VLLRGRVSARLTRPRARSDAGIAGNYRTIKRPQRSAKSNRELGCVPARPRWRNGDASTPLCPDAARAGVTSRLLLPALKARRKNGRGIQESQRRSPRKHRVPALAARGDPGHLHPSTFPHVPGGSQSPQQQRDLHRGVFFLGKRRVFPFPGAGQPSAANPAANRARQLPGVSGRCSPAPGLCLAHHPGRGTETQTGPWGESAASSAAFIPLGCDCLCRLHASPPPRVRRPLPEVPRLAPPRGPRVSDCIAPRRAAPSADRRKARVLTWRFGAG